MDSGLVGAVIVGVFSLSVQWLSARSGRVASQEERRREDASIDALRSTQHARSHAWRQVER